MGVSASSWPVALVAMPFMQATKPSIQLGLLKALAERNGYPTTTFPLGIDLAAKIGLKVYERFCGVRKFQTGDWLFSNEAFGAASPDRNSEFIGFLNENAPDHLQALGLTDHQLCDLRQSVIPEYLTELLEKIEWSKFRVVGFTTTFQQTVPSLALARILKDKWPDITIVFGGSNCDGGMGQQLLQHIEWIDYVAVGEADLTFPALLDSLRNGFDPLLTVPGLAARRLGEVISSPPAEPVRDLDSLPTPDYADHVERAERLGVLQPGERHLLRLPFESARGCWWGAKHHCTFCGLNDETISFRSKSAARVREELAQLVQVHGTFCFDAVDNILNTRFFAELLPELLRTDYDFFYEIKANLKRDQVKQLRLAGIRSVQPGIESFSTSVLKLIRKGTTAIQNVNVLRWALYYGIMPYWNLIWGFVGEQSEWVTQQTELLPRLRHLVPPVSGSRVFLTRFSPMFDDPSVFPVTWKKANKSYEFTFPRGFDLDGLAYMFDYESDAVLPDSVYEPLALQVKAWTTAWRSGQRPALRHFSSPGSLRIEDSRDPNARKIYFYREPAASIYLGCCDEPRTAEQLVEAANGKVTTDDVIEVFGSMLEEGHMMRDDRRYLCLSLPGNPWR